jgi:hypothetical protein
MAAAFSIGKLQWYDAAERAFSPALPEWVSYGLTISLWIALALTIYSGAEYVWIAIKTLRRA